MQQTLTPDAAAPSEARRLTDTFLAESQVSAETRRVIVLVVSELVTNAVKHGSPPVSLALTVSPEHVVVEVRDFGAPMPPEHPTLGDSSGGRGLFIVEQLCDRWGARSHAVGKTVWCDVSTTSTASPW